MMLAFLRAERGGAAVEAALVMPFLMALGLGGADAGGLFLESHKIKAGVASAARLVANAQVPENVEAQARNLAVTGQRTGGTPRVRGWTTAGVTISYRQVSNSGSLYNGPSNVRIVRVEGVHTSAGFEFLQMFGMPSFTLRAVQEERWLG